MRLSLKPLAAAVLFLASAAPALAADPSPAERTTRPDRPERADARSPLAAMGGSTFDPQSLTGAVTLERLLQGLAPNRGLMPTVDLVGEGRAMKLANDVGALGAYGGDRLSPDQLAHLRRALSHSGVSFEYRVVQAQKIAVSCTGMEEKSLRADSLKPQQCVGYTKLLTLEPPTYLLGRLANREARNATFVLSPSPERRQTREDGLTKPTCSPDSAWFDAVPKAATAESFPAGDLKNLEMASTPVTLLEVSALIDQRVLGQVLGKDEERTLNTTPMFKDKASCIRSSVWTFAVPSRGTRLNRDPVGEVTSYPPLSTQ